MNTRKIFFSFTLLLIVTAPVLHFVKPVPEPVLTETGSLLSLLDDSTNVLDDAKLINGKEAPQPPTTFRPGHVSVTHFPNHPVKTADGFELKMASSTQIPSPAIYNGKIYVGGGFGSRQFYCFDALTGKEIWSIDLDDDGPSSPVVQDGIVVFNTESCTIFACDAETGKMLWSWFLGDPLMSMPTIVNGSVFTAYPAPYAYINDGSKSLNQFPANNNASGTPTGDNISKPGPEIKSRLQPTHVLASFELKTGKILWQKWIDGDVMSAPVGIGKDLLVTTFPGTVYRFSQDNGEILSANSVRATSAPVVVNGQVFMSRRSDSVGAPASEEIVLFDQTKSESKSIYNKEAKYLQKEVQESSSLKSASMHLDAGNGFTGGAPTTSGATKAAFNIGQSNVSSLQSFQGSRALVYQNRSYTMMGDEMVVNDNESGKTLWKQKMEGSLETTGGFLATPPLVAGGNLIFGTLSGEIILMDPVSGKETKRYKTNGPVRQQPVVENGWIYCTTTDGKLVAINTGDKTLTGWPVWGKDNAHSGIPSE